MKFDIQIVPYEAFDDPLLYLMGMSVIAKEGTVSMELNRFLNHAVHLAKEDNFTPTEEYGLGDFYADKQGFDETGVVVADTLNMAGSLYFKNGQYPLIYTVDENKKVIDVDLPEESENKE